MAASTAASTAKPRQPGGPAQCHLEECARSQGAAAAWDMLDRMRQQGHPITRFTISRLLMKTVADGRGPVNRATLYQGIGAVEQFMLDHPGEADEVLFNALLDACYHVKDLARLEAALRRMEELKVEPSHVTLGILVKAFGQAGDAVRVVSLWDKMSEQRDQANAVTHGCMIDACVRCGRQQKAMEIFQDMKRNNKHRNTILYTTLIKGFGMEKDLRKALALFREMKGERVPYNRITFNSIIDVCIKCNDVQAAEYLFGEMTAPGSNVEPDLITFSTLLKGYCHIGELDKALQLAENMKSSGLRCDELVYNTLMDGCVKANDITAGVGLFEEMIHSGMRPSAITHSILARLYQRAGYDDAPGSIAQLYQQHGIERPSGGDRGRTGMGPRGNRRARSPSGSTRAGDFSGSGTPLGSPLGSPSGASLRSESLNPFVFEGFDCISAGNSAPATPLNGSPAASPAHRGGAGLFLPPDALRGGCVPPLPGADPCASAVAARWPSVDQSPGANMAAMSPFGAAGGCSFAQAQQALPPFPFQPCGPPAGDAGAQQMQQMIAMPVGSPVGAAGTPAGFGALSEPPHSALSPTSAQPMGTPTGMLQAQHPSFMMPMPGPGDGHFAVQGHAQQAYFDTWGRQQAPQHAPQQLPQMPPQEQQALQEHHMQHMQHQFMQQQMQQQMQQHQMHLQQVQQVQQMMQPAHMGGCVGHGASFEPGRPS
mmetsp:Transcript_36282/g.97463  ORF Transcript_36282/g.97463 Transcript_36282/m.97463 type:complete len:712 (-) Transcript_36282:302-2437(-)